MEKCKKDLEEEKRKSRLWMGLGITAIVIGAILIFVVIFLVMRGPEIERVPVIQPGTILTEGELTNVENAKNTIKKFSDKLVKLTKTAARCKAMSDLCDPCKPCPVGDKTKATLVTKPRPVTRTLKPQRRIIPTQVSQMPQVPLVPQVVPLISQPTHVAFGATPPI